MRAPRGPCLCSNPPGGGGLSWFVGGALRCLASGLSSSGLSSSGLSRPLVCRNSPQGKNLIPLALFLLLARPKTSSMPENQTERPASDKRPTSDQADPPPPPHLPPTLSILPYVPTKNISKKCTIFAVVSNYGFCEAHRALIHRAASAKKQRTARAPPTGSVAGLKARLCHLSKEKDGSKCKGGCSDHGSAIYTCRVCSHTIFASASENFRERPYFDMTA
jgi:hypothetical protein